MLNTANRVILAGCIVLLAACAMDSKSADQAPKNPVNPKAAQYNIQLGLAYLNSGNIQRAKSKLLMAMEQNPRSALTYDAMAYFHEKTGNQALANEFYLKAIKLEPNRGEALNNYGTFLCHHNKFESAEHYFLSATKIKEYTQVAQAYENAGLCALKQSAFSKAEYYFKKALKEDMQLKTSLIELSKIALQQQKPILASQYIIRFKTKDKHSNRVLAQVKEIDNALAKSKSKQAMAYRTLLKQQFQMKT